MIRLTISICVENYALRYKIKTGIKLWLFIQKVYDNLNKRERKKCFFFVLNFMDQRV